ncbi:PDZ domain-containing protein GIPC1 [Acromyrmex echinatior]|uniref:PDZ domain-containing protein GIPC1 n=1 Tax=Acromyrmex echinatior TaxID=103372 RepID=F4WRD8_ACREC|nr:PDZ domain-containing protein GIPC1 [Acromyrmex echinatior]
MTNEFDDEPDRNLQYNLLLDSSDIIDHSRMPLFKARITPRSPVTEKAANGMQYYNHQHHQHQTGNDNGHDNDANDNGTGSRSGNGAPPLQHEQTRSPPRDPRPSTLVFHCQLAHGSPTGLISDFSNVRELYQKIAERYDLPAEENPRNAVKCRQNYASPPLHLEKSATVPSDLMVMELLGVETAWFPTQSVPRREKRHRTQEAPVTDRGLSLVDLADMSRLDERERGESHILFCTLNTHKVDMTELLGGQIGVGDFIFAHKKGQPKEIELVKTDDALGLTITDNGAGYAFIKRIKVGSVIDRIKVIEVGDHIERIDSTSLVGRRHFEVAKMLKDIPKGSTFTLRLVEPQKNGFGSIGPRGDLKKGKKLGYGSGKETLRFKADGSAQIVEQIDDAAAIGVEKINTILESFMGISDTELATQIWELAEGKCNSIDFAEAIDNSDLEDFGFTDDFVIELWGAVTDARAGRHR